VIFNATRCLNIILLRCTPRSVICINFLSMEGLSVETVARDEICQVFPFHFERVYH
jgi:hypothetical protein